MSQRPVFSVVRQPTGLVDEILLPLEESLKFFSAIAEMNFDAIVFAQGAGLSL
jgi:hypothetical protein